jgi:tetratricopeptide (TPR) repeat protein
MFQNKNTIVAVNDEAQLPKTAGASGFLRSPGSRTAVFGLLLVAVTLAVYNPASGNAFLSFDDDHYVTENPQVRAGLHSGLVSWAFTTFEQANWHPLTWLSHALDCQIFHLNPAGHHYVNLLFHCGNALLLFLILQWFTKYTGRSLMVAALFALHPLNVESVAWIAERKTVLCMFFALLAVASYGWYVRKPRVGRYLVVAVLVAMSLLAKPMSVTLPFLFLILDYWPLGRMRFPETTGELNLRQPPFSVPPVALLQLCLEKILFLLLSLGSAWVTMVAQRAGGAMLSAAQQSPVLRIENSVVAYVWYLTKAAWPANLTALYPYPHSLPLWHVVLAASLLCIATAGVIQYRWLAYLPAGWFWFLGTLVPMIGLVQVGNQATADRYAYLPMVGIFILVVWAMADLAHVYRIKTAYLACIGILILLGFSMHTQAQIAYWHDDASLWSHALDVTHDNYLAENSLGVALMKLGRRDEGIAHFRAAETIEPREATNQLNLGIVAQEQGDFPQAAARYEKALRLTTDKSLRAYAHANLGQVYLSLGNYPAAQHNLESALQLNRAFPAFFFELGLIAQKNGDWNSAANYFTSLVSLEPSDVGYLLLSRALANVGRAEDSQQAEQRAQQLSTDMQKTQLTADQVALK